MMLDHLGETDAAKEIEAAIETSLETPQTKTRDLGGSGDTKASEAAILSAIGESCSG